jgi:hypothetical protein
MTYYYYVDSDGLINLFYVFEQDIKEQLVSTDCADCLIEIETVDAQPSHVDGVIILVAGYFTTAVVKQKFIQSFFLAPQENSGYYVLNDTFRLTGISFEVKVVAANHDNKSTQITTLPNEPGDETLTSLNLYYYVYIHWHFDFYIWSEIDSFKESEVPGVPPAGNILVNDGVISTSANVVSPVKNDPVVETCVKVVNEDVVKIPVAAPASTPVTAEEVVNKDFVKIPESAPALPSSVEKAAPAPPASVEKAAAAPPASVEKGAPAPRAPVEKADPAPSAPVEKGAPALRAPVEKADPAPRAPVEKEVTRKTYASVVSFFFFLSCTFCRCK